MTKTFEDLEAQVNMAIRSVEQAHARLNDHDAIIVSKANQFEYRIDKRINEIERRLGISGAGWQTDVAHGAANPTHGESLRINRGATGEAVAQGFASAIEGLLQPSAVGVGGSAGQAVTAMERTPVWQQMANRVRELEIFLHGDREHWARYEAAKNGNYPNPQPPAGAMESMMLALRAQDQRIAMNDESNKGRLAELAAKVRHVLAWIEPAIEGQSPPLDAQQIATKDFVDKHIDLIARTLRGELANYVTGLRKDISDLGARLMRDLVQPDAWNIALTDATRKILGDTSDAIIFMKEMTRRTGAGASYIAGEITLMIEKARQKPPTFMGWLRSVIGATA